MGLDDRGNKKTNEPECPPSHRLLRQTFQLETQGFCSIDMLKVFVRHNGTVCCALVYHGGGSIQQRPGRLDCVRLTMVGPRYAGKDASARPIKRNWVCEWLRHQGRTSSHSSQAVWGFGNRAALCLWGCSILLVRRNEPSVTSWVIVGATLGCRPIVCNATLCHT